VVILRAKKVMVYSTLNGNFVTGVHNSSKNLGSTLTNLIAGRLTWGKGHTDDKQDLGVSVLNVFCLGDLAPDIFPSLLHNMSSSNIQHSVLSFKKS